MAMVRRSGRRVCTTLLLLTLLVVGMGTAVADNHEEPDADRVEDTTEYPYSAVVQIGTIEDGEFVGLGTGAIVGDNKVVTAAHVVTREDETVARDDLVVAPGVDSDEVPYGANQVDADDVDIDDDYEPCDSSNCVAPGDFAVLTLDRPFAPEAGQFEVDWIDPDDQDDYFVPTTPEWTAAGYPDYGPEHSMWKDSAVFRSTTTDRESWLEMESGNGRREGDTHQMLTGSGHSGSPVWQPTDDGQRAVRGVVTNAVYPWDEDNEGLGVDTIITGIGADRHDMITRTETVSTRRPAIRFAGSDAIWWESGDPTVSPPTDSGWFTVGTTLYNNGPAQAEDVTVAFYLSETGTTVSTRYGHEICRSTVSSADPYETVRAACSDTVQDEPYADEYNVVAVVDPDDEIDGHGDEVREPRTLGTITIEDNPVRIESVDASTDAVSAGDDFTVDVGVNKTGLEQEVVSVSLGSAHASCSPDQHDEALVGQTTETYTFSCTAGEAPSDGDVSLGAELAWGNESDGEFDRATATIAHSGSGAGGGSQDFDVADATFDNDVDDKQIVELRGTFYVTATVSNPGSETATRDVTMLNRKLPLDGSLDDRLDCVEEGSNATRSVTLQPGESREVTLGCRVPESTVKGEFTTIVTTAGSDTPEDRVRYDVVEDQNPSFDPSVSVLGTDPSVGEAVEVRAWVYNDAGPGTRTVTLRAGDEVLEQREMYLDRWHQKEFSTTWTPSDGTRGEVRVTLDAGDAQASTTENVTPAEFDVDVEDPLPRVSSGESVPVDVTVTNRGGARDTHNFTVQFDGETRAERRVSVAGGTTRTVTLNVTVPGDASEDQSVGVASETDEDTATLPVGPANEAPTTGIEVESSEVVPNRTIAFAATNATDPDGNVTSYEWSIGNDSTATGPTMNHTFDAAGSYAVGLTVTDDDGASSTAVATVNVTGSSSVAPVVGGDPPTDPDGDGLYEDVNGDGKQNLADAGDLFQHRESSAVQGGVEDYDFSGNGEIDLADVVQLFQENAS